MASYSTHDTEYDILNIRMNRHLEPEGTLFSNRRFLTWAVIPIEGEEGQLIRLPEVVARITASDLDETHQWGHIAGLIAARGTQLYLETELVPIHEKSLDLGMLAMMSCFITADERLEEAEIKLAGAYQRQILFTGVLEDQNPDRTRPLFASVASAIEAYIDQNRYWYPDGRQAFRESLAVPINSYQDFIRKTPPIGVEIDTHRRSNSNSPHLIKRFIQLRDSLQSYTPTLAALEEKYWPVLRQKYARIMR